MRDKILADIREALKIPLPEMHPDPGPGWPLTPSNGRGLIEEFREKFEAVGGVWIETDDPDKVIQGKVWRSGPIGDPNQWDATVTDCDVAIAETGSFGLIAKPGRGRLASLVAPVHYVLVRRDQFVKTLDDWLAYLQPRLGSQAVLITGPSRSADIEQILTIGVHGPGKVYAVLYA
jgi:L-lactate dehydrogenase complex protein LldG